MQATRLSARDQRKFELLFAALFSENGGDVVKTAQAAFSTLRRLHDLLHEGRGVNITPLDGQPTWLHIGLDGEWYVTTYEDESGEE